MAGLRQQAHIHDPEHHRVRQAHPRLHEAQPGRPDPAAKIRFVIKIL